MSCSQPGTCGKKRKLQAAAEEREKDRVAQCAAVCAGCLGMPVGRTPVRRAGLVPVTCGGVRIEHRILRGVCPRGKYAKGWKKEKTPHPGPLPRRGEGGRRAAGCRRHQRQQRPEAGSLRHWGAGEEHGRHGRGTRGSEGGRAHAVGVGAVAGCAVAAAVVGLLADGRRVGPGRAAGEGLPGVWVRGSAQAGDGMGQSSSASASRLSLAKTAGRTSVRRHSYTSSMPASRCSRLGRDLLNVKR